MGAIHTARWAKRQMERDPEGFRARRNAARAKWQALNREKHNAHCRVYDAIKAGRLVRPDACEKCRRSCRPEAAHIDYSRPLDVLWLCRQCHARLDAAPRTAPAGKDI